MGQPVVPEEFSQQLREDLQVKSSHTTATTGNTIAVNVRR